MVNNDFVILIVDDNSDNLKIFGKNLRKKYNKILVSGTGQHALKLARDKKPDLILLDIMMPEMNGFEVCKILKEDKDLKVIPVIFLTAKTEEEDIVKGFSLGAVDYITKPVNLSELFARVETQKNLAEAKREALEAEKVRSVLAATVTFNHEINQPLTALEGYFFMLKDSLESRIELTKDEKHYFDKLSENVKSVDDIMKKFRNSTKFEFKKYSEDTEMIEFNK